MPRCKTRVDYGKSNGFILREVPLLGRVEGMEITHASADDIPELAEILAEVFAEDPVMLAMLKEGKEPVPVFRKFFAEIVLAMYLPRGRVDVVRDEGQVVGVAVWQAPDTEVQGFEKVRFSVNMLRVFGTSVRRAMRAEEESERIHPKFSHWYLSFIAVASSARGKGVGGMLLDHGIEEAGNMPCYLESTTPASRALYARKGFITLGILAQGTPDECTCMWRPGKYPWDL